MAKRTKTDKKTVNDGYTLTTKTGETKLVVAVSARNKGQKDALRTISENKVTILSGVPGTGKTHIAVGWGLQQMVMKKKYEQIIFTRPVVEAGESLGYLPGSAEAKVAPYMMPMYDVVSDYLSNAELAKFVDEKKIVVLPLAYMRGVTFKNAYVVCDEMQNASVEQMHLLLTRIGEGSKVVCTGDTEQSDLVYHKSRSHDDNGLADALTRLKEVEGVGFVELGYNSCVRESIVNDIDACYRSTDVSLPSWDKKVEIDAYENEIDWD